MNATIMNGSLALLLFLLLSNANAAQCERINNADIVGEAVSIKTGEFLYCEYHYLSGEPYTVEGVPVSLQGYQTSTAEVYYMDAEQQLIARKKVDYSLNPFSPNIEQEDFRHQEWVKVERDLQANELLVQYRRANQESIKQKAIAGSELVVDAGFNNAIRSRWQEMADTGSAVFTFVASAQLRTVSLKVASKKLSSCFAKADIPDFYQDGDHVCYKVSSNNALVNLFIKPIYLVYKEDSRRLSIFRGAVNISTDAGKGQQAIIEYQYY